MSETKVSFLKIKAALKIDIAFTVLFLICMSYLSHIKFNAGSINKQ